jgi:hypothetical protein
MSEKNSTEPTIEKSEYKVGGKSYVVERKELKSKDVRREQMPVYPVTQDRFTFLSFLQTDFICKKCKQEIDGPTVYFNMSDNEYLNLIREKKDFKHLGCIEYEFNYPYIGYVSLFDQKQTLKNKQDLEEIRTNKEVLKEEQASPPKTVTKPKAKAKAKAKTTKKV